MTRVTVLPGARTQQQQQQQANAPIKAQPKPATPSQKANQQSPIAPVAAKNNNARSLNPSADLQFNSKGKENSFSTAGRTPPVPHVAKPLAAGKINLQNTFGPQQQQQKQQQQQQQQKNGSAHTSRSNSAVPQKIVNHKQPDWCNDDVSTHELNTDDDDMWYMNYLFGAPPSPTKMAAAPKSRPPLPAKAKTQQLQQQQKGGNNKRNRVKKPLSAQERAEINYFVAHLFDGPSPKSRSASNYNKAALAPTKKRNRVKKPLSAQEKAEINYFVAHLFDGPSSVKAKPIQKTNSPATAPAQNRRRGNKKPLTHQERLEISNFVTHLFDGTPQIKITRKQQKLTTQERNEICYFVNHLFDYGKTKKPMVIRKKAQQKKKFVLLYNVEKENARKAVFDIWAAANPGWGTSRHQNGPYPKSERSQRMRRNRQAKKAARQRKALRRHRNL